jgi:hypothetical protein
MLVFKLSTQKIKTTLPRYKSWPQPTNITFFCILKIRIQSSNGVYNFINTSKYSYILTRQEHVMNLYIYATFNIRTQKAIYIICVYKSPSSLISMFFNTLESLIQNPQMIAHSFS